MLTSDVYNSTGPGAMIGHYGLVTNCSGNGGYIEKNTGSRNTHNKVQKTKQKHFPPGRKVELNARAVPAGTRYMFAQRHNAVIGVNLIFFARLNLYTILLLSTATHSRHQLVKEKRWCNTMPYRSSRYTSTRTQTRETLQQWCSQLL